MAVKTPIRVITLKLGCCLKNEYSKRWEEELFNDIRVKDYGNKLRNYRIYKKSFFEEEYLVHIGKREHRSALTKLRLSAHKLEIEMGRYATKDRKKPDDRICKYCKNG